MIARIWKGATPPNNSDDYALHLRDHILPELARLKGYAGAFVLRRPVGDVGRDVAFTVITLWQSEHAIRAFAGEDVETAVVPPEAQALLSAYDERAVHWEIALAKLVVTLDNVDR